MLSCAFSLTWINTFALRGQEEWLHERIWHLERCLGISTAAAQWAGRVRTLLQCAVRMLQLSVGVASAASRLTQFY